MSLDLGPTHSRAGGDLKLQAETGETVELEGLHLGTTGLTLALSGPGLTPQSFDRGLTGLLDDSRWRVEATLDTESLLLPAPTADPARNELPWQARNLGFHVLLRDPRRRDHTNPRACYGSMGVAADPLGMASPGAPRGPGQTRNSLSAGPVAPNSHNRVLAGLRSRIGARPRHLDGRRPGTPLQRARKGRNPCPPGSHWPSWSTWISRWKIFLSATSLKVRFRSTCSCRNSTVLSLLKALGQPTTPWQLTGDIEGTLTLDPARPTAAEGQWHIDRPWLALPDHQARSLYPVRMTLADRRLEIEPTELLIDERAATLEVEAVLSEHWDLNSPLQGLLTSLSARLAAEMEASQLESLAEGLETEGRFKLDLHLHGEKPSQDVDLEQWLQAELRVDGADAALTMPQPYVTRLNAIVAEGRWHGGELQLDLLRGRLNEGELELFGTIGMAEDGDLHANIRGFFDRVRYRLDYGLTTLSSGNLHWLKNDSDDLLRANILVERGSARRRIDAGRELMNRLLAPPEPGARVRRAGYAA